MAFRDLKDHLYFPVIALVRRLRGDVVFYKFRNSKELQEVPNINQILKLWKDKPRNKMNFLDPDSLFWHVIYGTRLESRTRLKTQEPKKLYTIDDSILNQLITNSNRKMEKLNWIYMIFYTRCTRNRDFRLWS